MPVEPQSPNAEVEQLVGELRDERSKRADAQRNAADADWRVAASTARARELEEKVREAQHGKAEAERRVAFLETKQTKDIPNIN